MKIYWFERHDNDVSMMSNRSKELEIIGFDGIMYPYSYYGKDYFTKIARTIDIESSFHYIIAIRCYTLSPQYLTMLCNSMDDISKNRVSVNLLSGWIYDHEKEVGGIFGDVNDNSNNVDRSKYMIDFAKTLSNIKPISPKFYVSATNSNVINQCIDNNFDIIIPYSKINDSRLENLKYIVSVAPIFDNTIEKKYSDSDFFTKESFFDFLDHQNNRAEAVLIFENTKNSQYDTIKSLIKEYRLTRKENI